MYDRAPRVTELLVGSTGKAVGPGAYNVEQTSKTRIRMDAYAPFGSLVERSTGLIDESHVVSVPGPGYYDGSLPVNRNKVSKQGGVSMSFTSQRFPDAKEKLPGPGAYDVSRAESDSKSKSAPMPRTSRIKFFRAAEPPSIPVPKQAYGYEEDNGILIKQSPPSMDDSLGPAFYSIPQEDFSRTTKKYKGPSFGRTTSRRDDFFSSERDVPGPGTYNTVVEKKQVRENVNVLRESGLPQEKPNAARYTEEIIKKEEKQKLPGPGQYALPRAFESSKAKDGEQAPFGTTSRRFSSKHESLPGPGAYNDPRGALDSLKKVTSMKRNPFGQTSVRFDGSSNGDVGVPGPASYVLADGIGQVSMRKLVMESARKGAFGSSAPRNHTLVRQDEFSTPGPAQYQPREKPFAPRYHSLSSMFSSMTSRFEQLDAAKPAPGSYDVARSFDHLHSQSQPKAPQNDEARKRRFAPGAAAAPRASLARVAEESPAPNAYDKPSDARHGVVFNKSERFRSEFSEAPGPGSYSLAPSVRDSVWKNTFNITLGAPELHSVAPGAVEHASLVSSSKLSFLDASGHSRLATSQPVAAL